MSTPMVDEDDSSAAVWPTAPKYNFTAPKRLTDFDASEVQSDVPGCFFRSARWAADTSSVLTTAEDRVLRIFESHSDESDGSASFSKPREYTQPDAVNVALWYPAASSQAPETYCCVASVRDSPVRLIDASDGRIRASYPIVDHRERFVAPHSIAFNTTADKIYCGFENAIEIFDIAYPGYSNGERLKTTSTRKEKGGQRGIISALSFSAHCPGTYAAGSFAGSVFLYDEDISGATGVLEGVEGGGVTQLAYHPLDPNVLFVASRRSNALQVFDLRDASQPISQLGRPASSNQRITFDLDPWGRWITSGDENGVLRVWDISNTNFDLVMEQKLSDDAINSAQFHLYKPLLLTSTGSRALLQNSDLEFSSNDSADSDSDSDDELSRVIPPAKTKDARLSIWSMADTAT